MTLRIPPITTPVAGEGYDKDPRAINSIWYRYLQALQASIPAGGGGIPEAPQDGITYGRNNATWVQVAPLAAPFVLAQSFSGIPTARVLTAGANVTITDGGPGQPITISATTGTTSLPGGPQYAVQFNDPVGTFAGTGELRFDSPNNWLKTGQTGGPFGPFLIAPETVSTAANALSIRAGNTTGVTANGGDLSIAGGSGGTDSSARGGNLTLSSGAPFTSGLGGRDGNVVITTPNSGNNNPLAHGLITITTGNSATGGTSDIFIGTGSAVGNGNAGNVRIAGGANGAGFPNFGGGGSVAISGGNGAGSGGSVTITTGASVSGGGYFAGDFAVTTAAGNAQRAGNVTYSLGSVPSGNFQGGSFAITTGNATNGTGGDITFNFGTGSVRNGRFNVNGDVFVNGTQLLTQNAPANTVLARAANTAGAVSGVALAASQLLGRGATGDVAAITLGSGLLMTGTTLSATGGGAGVGSLNTLTGALTITAGTNISVSTPTASTIQIDASGAGPLSPETYPASPNAADDEFDGASLDTAGTRRPGATAWAWQNQGAATANLSHGSVAITPPFTGSANLRIIEQVLPVGNWRYRARVMCHVQGANNLAGMVLRNSATGRLLTFHVINNAGTSAFQVARWTNVTTFSATNLLTAFTEVTRRWIYLEIEWDGATFTFRYSWSGNNNEFQTFTTEAAATFITSADRIGFVSDPQTTNTFTRLISDWFRRLA